jgi:hypothetical protein
VALSWDVGKLRSRISITKDWSMVKPIFNHALLLAETGDGCFGNIEYPLILSFNDHFIMWWNVLMQE